MEVRSRIDGSLLHLVSRRQDIGPKRRDLSPEHEGLQVAVMQLHDGQTFRPHRHRVQPRPDCETQESWIVLSGRVRVTFYDLDDTVLTSVVLDVGDLSVTFRGGHAYEGLEDGSEIVECKSGPFRGREADKVFIGNE